MGQQPGEAPGSRTRQQTRLQAALHQELAEEARVPGRKRGRWQGRGSARHRCGGLEAVLGILHPLPVRGWEGAPEEGPHQHIPPSGALCK